ncbi:MULTISPECIES: HNH endonuclease family protein [unclassified Mesorhizobium]|uniref:HNH endonuclease family protein n=1 Tax=unclassified Mesorhizobium TaxID=325217 RepID=UPI00112B580F|nr:MULTISPECIES: DUF262 domain-containing protein [unclassified Mesorhizobium]MBZ9806937.1 DUF262 domain-containing protein [Mesorhizobium sp. ESP-6-2]TPM30382.1 DUF262 domain-containing protein [Mesorhizobium sp. B2-2-2]
MAAATTNIVNLDALIRREDLAAPGEVGEDISSLSIAGLEPKGFLYPALRKPDFQRETANWSPEQVADLIGTFARKDLIPAVILWRAGQNVFVIDGAHRLSALVAWVHNDYGDGEVSRHFFQNAIPDDQQIAARRTRDLVALSIGSYADHKMAIEYPQNSRPDIAERAARIGWQEIPAQWIRNADHDKAEKAFFRINQGGTKIDATERRILAARRSSTALAARAILRAGTGHNYWKKFAEESQREIEDLGREISALLFEPTISLPIKTLDLPPAGQGYGPQALPLVFDLVNLANRVQVRDSSYKGATKEEPLDVDQDGVRTVDYLVKVRAAIWRLCSTHASSLGLHPALYFYSRNGTFSASSLLTFLSLFRDWGTDDFLTFTKIRAKFEEFLMANRGMSEAVRKLGSGVRSRPRAIAFYKAIVEHLTKGFSASDVAKILREMPEFEFLITSSGELDLEGGSFSRDVKGAAFIRDALPTAPKCPTCGGLLHRNGMQFGHKRPKRDGGSGNLSNAMMQHPFCNSTVDN